MSGSSELNLDISFVKNIYLSPNFGSPMILEISFSWYLAEFKSMYALLTSNDSFDESSLYLISNFFIDSIVFSFYRSTLESNLLLDLRSSYTLIDYDFIRGGVGS